MSITERLELLVSATTTKARDEFSKLSGSLKSTFGDFDKFKASFAQGIGIGAGASFFDTAANVVQKAGQFAFDQVQQAVSAASDLQQSQGAVNAIFRESSGVVRAYGRDAAESVGLSEAAFGQQASTIGALLQNLGQTRAESAQTSQELIQIGADLAATFGGNTSDAVNALGAALRGERDPIERYGISIKQAGVDAEVLRLGLDTSTASLKAQAQATATLSLIRQQAANSAGAFAREEDTLQGQTQRFTAELENARAELGQALLPVLTDTISVLRSGIPVLQAFGVGIEAAADAASTASSVVGDLADNAETLFGAVPGVFGLSRGFDALKSAATPATGSIVAQNAATWEAELAAKAAAAATTEFGTASEAAAAKIAEATKAVDGVKASMFGAESAQSKFLKAVTVTGGAASDSGRAAERAFRRIEDAQRGVLDAQEQLNEALVERFIVGLGATSDDIALAQVAERDSTRSLSAAKRELVEAEKRLGELRQGSGQASQLDAEANYIDAQRKFVEAQNSGDVVQINRAKADLIRTEQELNRARAGGTADEIAVAEDDLAAAQDAVVRAEIAAKQSRQDLNDLLNAGKEGSKELAAANKQVEEAQQRVQKSEESLIDAQDALNQSTSGLAGSQKSVNDQFIDGVEAADSYLKYLIDNKAKPEEFASAVKTVYDNLKNVADQAGRTPELDAYLEKVTTLYTTLQNIGNTPIITSTSTANAAEETLNRSRTTVQLNLDGRTFGEAVVSGLLAYQNANGKIPIKVG